ncbi:unnamed protein product [Periconia digitata]|uniref:AB hydrolase-1 domain-containing protein n=1 Tax=Periconia digitata TaxID=1303443 RepID=A0A9W4U184_9PLEO|nr:unnamed protein product [Periconia digitata]
MEQKYLHRASSHSNFHRAQVKMHFSFSLFAQASLFFGAVTSLTIRASNADQSYTTKSLTTKAGYTYTYDFAPAQNASKPTILLLHGYPSSRRDWQHQIASLTAEGFGIVAPDMLGFGETSKPTEIEAYNGKSLATQLVEILDAEGLQEVVGVGHDWGAGVLSKLTTWYPKRFTKLVFVSTSYFAAGILFDIDALNKQGLETVGYQPFGYWYFFNSWDTAGIIADHLESFIHLAYHTNSSAWAKDFADLGAARVWLNANTTTESPSWFPEGYKEHWLREWSQPNITASSLNYYQSLMRGVNAADEAALTDEDRALNVPVLAIGSARDQIAPPEVQRAMVEPWAKAGFEQHNVDAGHWATLERAEEVSQLLIEFAG